MEGGLSALPSTSNIQHCAESSVGAGGCTIRLGCQRPPALPFGLRKRRHVVPLHSTSNIQHPTSNESECAFGGCGKGRWSIAALADFGGHSGNRSLSFAAAEFVHHRGSGGGAAAGDAEFADFDEAIEVADAAGGFYLYAW